jgi:hypothetical protein
MKVAICALMSLGLLASGFNIARSILIPELGGMDFTYSAVSLFLSTMLELNLGIIAACIPTFQPLFRSLRWKSGNYGNGSRAAQNGSAGGFDLVKLDNKRLAFQTMRCKAPNSTVMGTDAGMRNGSGMGSSRKESIDDSLLDEESGMGYRAKVKAGKAIAQQTSSGNCDRIIWKSTHITLTDVEMGEPIRPPSAAAVRLGRGGGFGADAKFWV